MTTTLFGTQTRRPLHRHLALLLAAQLDEQGRLGAEAQNLSMAELGDLMIRDALRERASDIHLEPDDDGLKVRLRIDGSVFDAAVLERQLGARLVRHFKTLSDLDTSPTQRPQDARRTYRVDDRDIDIRLAVVPSIAGEKLAIRLLVRSDVERDINSLGLGDRDRDAIGQWLERAHGLFLVVGPTGSGKTTTLYSLLHHLRLTQRTITTIEDPVEYQVDGITQMQVNLKQGMTFAEATKAMMRLDSDYLLVGEIREAESARAALEAAGRGRVLMSTLHCRDAVAAVRSLRTWGMSDHDIAASLDMVIAQRLVRVLCPACRRQELASDADRIWFEQRHIPLPTHTWEPAGCAECHGMGYKGRTGVFEVWHLDEEDYGLLLGGSDELAIRQSLAGRAHRSLLSDGLAKADQGITSLEELKTMVTLYAPRLASLSGWTSEGPQERVCEAQPAGV